MGNKRYSELSVILSLSFILLLLLGIVGSFFLALMSFNGLGGCSITGYFENEKILNVERDGLGNHFVIGSLRTIQGLKWNDTYPISLSKPYYSNTGFNPNITRSIDFLFISLVSPDLRSKWTIALGGTNNDANYIDSTTDSSGNLILIASGISGDFYQTGGSNSSSTNYRDYLIKINQLGDILFSKALEPILDQRLRVKTGIYGQIFLFNLLPDFNFENRPINRSILLYDQSGYFLTSIDLGILPISFFKAFHFNQNFYLLIRSISNFTSNNLGNISKGLHVIQFSEQLKISMVWNLTSFAISDTRILDQSLNPEQKIEVGFINNEIFDVFLVHDYSTIAKYHIEQSYKNKNYPPKFKVLGNIKTIIKKIALSKNNLLVSGELLQGSNFQSVNNYTVFGTGQNGGSSFALELNKVSLEQAKPALVLMPITYFDIVGSTDATFFVAGYTKSVFKFKMINDIHGVSDGFILKINPNTLSYSGAYIGGKTTIAQMICS